MNPNGFTIVPNVVYDALERGVITSEMSDCLSLLYRWREHDSNVVREVSAERLKKWLSLLRPEYSAAEKKWPTAETIRRWMRGMLEAGWFTRDYEAGVERPYNVYLRNLGGYHVNFVEHVQGRPEGCAQLEKEELAQNDVNISEIKHWKQTGAFQGRAKESTSLSNEARGGARPFGADKDAKDQRPFAADAAGLRPASAAGASDLPPDLFSPSAPAGGTAQTPPGPGQSRSTPTGKGRLLKAMYAVAARELKNSHAVPATLKTRFDLVEAAHGFAAVIDDFTNWCRENFDRRPGYPLVEYVKIVDDRLGAPPMPDAQLAAVKKINPVDDPRVGEIIRYVYEYSKIAPAVKKVASLIATYGYEYVYGVVDHEIWVNEGAPIDAKWVKTLFSDSGGLAIITEYRTDVFNMAEDLVEKSLGSEEAAKKFCRNITPNAVIALADKNWEFERKAKIAKEAAAKKVK